MKKILQFYTRRSLMLLLCFSCIGANAQTCEVVSNGGFENASNCGDITPVPNNINMDGVPGVITDWASYITTPDLYAAGCSDGPGPNYAYVCSVPAIGGDTVFAHDNDPDNPPPYNTNNKHFIGLWGGYRGYYPGADYGWDYEAIQTKLAYPLVSGQKYTLSFWAFAQGAGRGDTDDCPVGFYKTTAAYPMNWIKWSDTLSGGLITNTVDGLTPLISSAEYFTIPADSKWHFIHTTFYYSGSAAQTMVVANVSYHNDIFGSYPTFGYDTYCYLDDISIVPAFTANASPNPTCAGITVTLDAAGILNDTYTWTSNGTVIGKCYNTDTCETTNIPTDTTTYVAVDSLYGCTDTITEDARLLPKLDSIIAADTVICNGGSALIYLVGTPNTTVSFGIHLGYYDVLLDSTGHATVNTGPLTNTTSSPIYYPCNFNLIYYTDGLGCTQSVSKAVNITVNPSPFASIPTYDTTVCDSASPSSVLITGTPGALVSYTIDPGASYNVHLNNFGNYFINTSGLADTGGLGPTCYTIYLNTVSNDTTGCTGSVSGMVQICVEPIPSATIEENQTICSGQSLIPINIASNYCWVKYTDPGGTTHTDNLTMSGMTSFSPPSNINTGDTPLVYVYKLDSAWFGGLDCGVPLNDSVVITVYPTPTATITPTDTITICNGTNPNIVINGTGTSVKYTISGVGSFTASFPDTLNPSIFVSTNPSSPTQYIITIDTVFNPACFSTGGQSLVVLVLPPPATSLSVFNSVVCANDAPEPYINFTGVPNTYAHYTFDGVADSILLSGGGTGQINITDTNTSSVAGTHIFILTGSGFGYPPYCLVPENDTVTITIKPLPTLAITTPGNLTEACQALTLTAVSNASINSHYDWYHNNTLWQTGFSNSFTAIDSGEYVVAVFDSVTGCHATDSILIDIDNPFYVDLEGTACGPFPFTLDPDITGGNTGAAYTYSWLSSPADPTLCASCAAPAVTPTVNTSYTVTVTDPASACAPAAAIADIVVSPAASCACSYCQPPSAIGTGGIINYSPSQMGFYYINNDVTISNPGGEITFDGVNVLVAAGVHIYVDKNTRLVLDGAHFFSCGGEMWDGFVLQSDNATASARIQAGKYTLIEDAKTGLLASRPVTPANFDPSTPAAGQSAFDVMWLEGVVFNHDSIGVSIIDYDTATGYYPFAIGSTVFTSRNIGLYGAGCGNSYPFIWQDSLGAPLPNLTGCTPAPPQYKITLDTLSPCHNGAYPSIGISLNLVGLQSATAGNSFPGILIGDSSGVGLGSITGDVIFDNLDYGVYAINSNLFSYGNLFMYMNHSSKSAGIFDSVTNNHYRYGLSLADPPKTGTYPNFFYDCASGVLARGLYNVNASNVHIFSTHTPDTSRSGKYGIAVQSSRYNDINITGSVFYNMDNTIAIWSLSDTGVRNGRIHLLDNTIKGDTCGFANLVAAGGLPRTYMQSGISVRNLNSLSGGMYIDTVDISNNVFGELSGTVPSGLSPYNSIYVSNYTNQATKIDSNTIFLSLDSTGATQQFGIEVANCNKTTVNDNFVYGPAYGVPTPPTLGYSGHILAGIYSTGNDFISMACNHAININTGFQFYGTFSTGVRWLDNVMEDNAFGFVLDGLIGQQGNASTPSDNEWDTSGGFMWTGSLHQTLVWGSGTDAANSKLFVRNATGFVPTNNTQFGGINPYNAPTPLYGVAYATPTTAAACLNYTSPYGKLTGGGADSATDSLMQRATQQRIDYTGNIWRKNWQAQYAVWRSLAADSTQADSSATLQQFRSMAASSRFSYLAGIENSLAGGDTATAQNMLNAPVNYMANTDTDAVTGVRMADDTIANAIVNNYRTYYKLYLHYMKGSMSSADSLQTFTMAQLCPLMNGAVVYQARALYSLIYDDLRVFDDVDCDDTTILPPAKPNRNGPAIQSVVTDVKQGQSYMLYPNPTDGIINLQQSVVDNAPVKAEILDELGQVLYSSALLFSAGHVQLRHENLASGLYLIKLQDSAGRLFVLKFVVEDK